MGKTEESYDPKNGNRIHFERIRRMGHDWMYVIASRRRGFVTDTDEPLPFNIVHAPDCPCMLEGVRVSVFGGNKATKQADASMLMSFKEDYDATFVGDEAEEWGDIVDRTTGVNRFYPTVHTYIAVLSDRGIPAGALVVEHYTGSNILLATYVFMRRELRRAGRGYATRLMREGVAEIRRRAAVPVGEARVFFEAENPDRMTPRDIAAATYDPRGRLGWFRALGARRLDFHYSQPPLASGKRPVDWLDMYTIDKEPVSSQILAGFLTEFYDVLGVNVAEADREAYFEARSKMNNELRQDRIVPETDF